MKKVCQLFILFFLIITATVSCDFRITHHKDKNNQSQENDKKNSDDDGKISEEKSKKRAAKLDAIYDNSKLGEITLTFTTEKWNELLSNTNSKHKTLYSSCNFDYIKDGNIYSISNIGIKNRGNTSFRAPEKTSKHTQDGSQYQQAHFKLKFTKYEDDDAHHLEKAAKAMNLKYMLTDKSYVQEMYSYDLFKRFGVWTAPRCAYTKLYITVGTTPKAYFGMYKSIETIDKQYLKARVADGLFKGDTGNLWKCLYQSGGPANLMSTNSNLFGVDTKNITPVYSLKTNEDTTEGINSAKTQFKNFISNLNSKSGSEFSTWIKSAFDVDGFLKALAVNVACGMWDDIWRNNNNYYLYFDEDGKCYFIPYDYDNSLGHSNDGLMSHPAEQNPLEWGTNENALVSKILNDEEFKAKYVSYLSELIDPSKDYFDKTKSVARINTWYNLIEPYCDKDIYDADYRASKDGHSDWSLAKGKPSSQYNLIEDDKNYFTIRTNAFKNAIQSSSTTTTTTTINNTKYTVTFDPNGGSFIGNYSGTEPITIKDIKYNTSVYEIIEDVEKSDLIILFWWIDEDGTVVEKITKDCTLTAYFENEDHLIGYFYDTDTITFSFYPYMYGYQSNDFKTKFGDLYIVGSFTSWEVDESYKMIYDNTKKMYSLTLNRNLVSDNSEFKYRDKNNTPNWFGATDRVIFTFEDLFISDFVGDRGNIKIIY